MSFSELPLSYCTNVHPGETFDQAFSQLRSFTGPLAGSMDRPIAAGLWLSQQAVSECAHNPGNFTQLASWLGEQGLSCHTMNAFPFGNFHAVRVKENVYLPDWTSHCRREYTCDVANLLAKLLPHEVEGSISTSPCAFKNRAVEPGYRPYFAEYINAARFLADLRRSTGKMIRLAIEPEPCCVLETTDEAIEFFRQLRQSVAGTGSESAVLDHLGLCFDVCHQAVEFEDVAESIHRLHQAKVRINKVHITNALVLSDPHDAGARQYLSKFAEERYLHQTFTLGADGAKKFVTDLTSDHALSPPEEWLTHPWRIHFHVPVNKTEIGPLSTTRPVLVEALSAVKALPYAPHLEVETYTWDVMPTSETPAATFDLVSGLHAELESTHQLLDELGRH